MTPHPKPMHRPTHRQRGSRARCIGMLPLVLLNACITAPPAPSSVPAIAAPPAAAPRPLPNVNLSGYPPAFKEGFRDGCDSFRGKERRDPNRFNKDNNYTIGWQDGFSICRRQGK
jgi:hypothetical protein